MVSRTAPADRSPPSASSRVEMHLNSILMHAIEGRASDIHLEPFEQGIRVRERKDGRLYDAPSPPMD